MLKIISGLYVLFYRWYGVEIKRNVRIKPLVFLSKGFLNGKKGRISIEAHCELSRGVILKGYGGSINIGVNTFLGEYAIIYGHGGVKIGSNTLIAMHTSIVSSNHTIAAKNELMRSKPDILLPVVIGDDVWVGAGVRILGGVTIGNGCVIGAGAVVTKDLPPFSVSAGTPARIMKYRND